MPFLDREFRLKKSIMRPTMTSSSSSSPSRTLPSTTTQMLIPGLPNDAAAQILSMVPYSHHSRLKLTCKSWYSFLSSKSVISLRRHLKHVCSLLCVFPQDPSISSPYVFDPKHGAWRPLPPMPCNPYVYGLCNFVSVSLGSQLYVLGGSLFDTRSFPMDRPSPTGANFRFDFVDFTWKELCPMVNPRGSFACGVIANSGQIIVAGGGSRHNLFGAAGSRTSSVERYDVERDEWVELDGMPRYRAGCVGFVVGRGENDDKEFWVMGGYGDSRMISRVFPVDEYYKDAVVMDIRKKGSWKWKEVGDMWGEGERGRLGKVVVVEEDDRSGQRCSGVFMLDKNEIFRYDMASNTWKYESTIPRKAACNSAFGFIGLDGELHVMSVVTGSDSTEIRRTRQHKKAGSLLIQIYNPRNKTWRLLLTKPPFNCPSNFDTIVMCSICL